MQTSTAAETQPVARPDLAIERNVGVYRTSTAEYSSHPPFSPATAYAEYPFSNIGQDSNPAYEGLRELFRLMGFDAGRFDTAAWNPLGFLVKPGMTVLLKPNMIRQAHTLRDTWVEVLTHGSVVRAVLDYVFLALEGRGRVVIADGPQADSLWEGIVGRMGLREIVSFYQRHAPDLTVDLIDLRNYTWRVEDDVWVEKIELPGDPMGNTLIDVGAVSAFTDAPAGRKYFGAAYDFKETQRNHARGHHRYSFSSTALTADVVINLPKLKTHKKCGVTASLKNLVGLNGNKNLLPHYSFGAPQSNGDQFAEETFKTRIENALAVTIKPYLNEENRVALLLTRKFKPVGYKAFGSNQQFVRSGNWHGNDTIWRTIADLNTILRFGHTDGTLGGLPRRYLSIVDGIIAGEGDGPMEPDPKPVGLLAIGTNPVAVDAVCARLMGFDQRKILHIDRSFGERQYPLAAFEPSDVEILSNVPGWCARLPEIGVEQTLKFRPHFGWTGHIEM